MKTKVMVEEVGFDYAELGMRVRITTAPLWHDHSEYTCLGPPGAGIRVEMVSPPESMQGVRPGDTLTVEITKDQGE